MRKWKYTKADYVACATEGLTKAETSRKLGVSPQCVNDAARRHKLEFKKKCCRGGHRMSPEMEEKLGRAMKLLAVDENKRMRERMGGSISYSALRSRDIHQENGRKLGGRKKESGTKELERIRKLNEISRLKERLKRLESQV